MPTNRSFLSHLFAALRPHRFLKPAASLAPQNQQAAAASTSTHLSSPRPIASSALSHSRHHHQQQQQQHQRALSHSPRSTSPTPIPVFGTSPPKHTQPITSSSPQRSNRSSSTAPLSTSPQGPPIPVASGSPQMSPPHRTGRRGSETSEGFRELRNEGWWIGGNTASGEERWLRLGMVRRSASLERSVDRLSL